MIRPWKIPITVPFELEVADLGRYSNCRIVEISDGLLTVDYEGRLGMRVREQVVVLAIKSVSYLPPMPGELVELVTACAVEEE